MLEDLRDLEFEKFEQPVIHEGYIKASKLDRAERQNTVDLLVNTYTIHGALKMTKKVLEKINRNDLVQSLSDTSLGTNGQ